MKVSNNKFNNWCGGEFSKISKFFLAVVLISGWIFAGWPQILQNPQIPPEVKKASAVISPAVVSLPRATHSFTTEQVGGSDAHVLILDNPGTNMDYKWQFLTGGIRLLINRNDGFGWVQLISQVQTAPEYKKQQGPPGNFVWNSYGLNINTAGANVLQGYDKQNQADDSVNMARAYSTFEEGIAETLTETWAVPANAEDLGSRGPKVTYNMTKNRGIVLTKGVEEGTWRMRWSLSGISDIVADSFDQKDADNWPLRAKTYSNGEFTIDVNDFDNAVATALPFHIFSEIGSNNKAEVLFFKDGTTGERVVDPTLVTENIATGWNLNGQRLVFYNGARFFLIYTKAAGTIYYKSSTDNTTWSGENSLVTDQFTTRLWLNLYLINDTTFDFIYINSAEDVHIKTCTISGATISCDSGVTEGTTAERGVAVARTSSANRIWFVLSRLGAQKDILVYYANQTGAAVGVSSFTNYGPTSSVLTDQVALVPYGSSDKVLVIFERNPGGSNNDGVHSVVCDTTSCGTVTKFITGLIGDSNMGNAVRISDSDFRYIAQDTAGLKEYKWDNTSWSVLATIDAETDQVTPSLFYDRISGDLYAFSIDTGTTPDTVERHKKPSGGSWETETVVDASEAADRSLPITQEVEPPPGSSRTTPRELVWAYRVANVSNFDLVVGNLNLAGGGASLTFVVSTDIFPAITPGSPRFATTTLSVNTDNSTGWNVTLSRDDANTTMDLDTDATVNIVDQTEWIPSAATTTAGNAARISSFINLADVLAMRVMTASGTASFISTAWWGATDAYIDSATTLWAGIASSTAANLKIGNSSISSGGSAKLNTVLYYLDVPSTQPTGAYSGGITYTATMNP